ncbi:MAG: signal peptidase I [Acidobacteria bacterium]|nr:signal peptidase I [Acidobacteriota bacterium]MBI1983334.1 signal peptidase I [Acidobacteriota bacterium]
METAEPKPESLSPESSPSAPAPKTAPSRRRDGFWETVRSLFLVLVGVFFIRIFVAEATVIPTGSMERTILIGDHVFLNKLLYGPRLPYTSLRVPPIKSVRRQEIVAFRYPRNPSVMYVKRVIGIGGDSVRVSNKRVFVNGEELDEPYVQFQYSTVLPLRDNFPPTASQIETLPAAWGLDPGWAHEMPRFIEDGELRVLPGYLFVMGDNRDNSQDSRFWGLVPESNVVGEPLFVYWSYDAPSQEWTNEDLMERMKFNLSIVWNFINKTRWSRTGTIF